MDHSDLVSEMSQVENLSTQERLHLARMRRAHQLKVAKQKEKEWLKSQSRRDRNSNNNNAKKRKHITFENSVVVLEAAARNDIDEVARLLESGVSPDATNEDGLTPLHQCCIDNNADMLTLLLDFGAFVNAKDSEKWTPLHAAATCGHLYLVKILINRGANLLAVNVDGNMPYDLCEDEETLDCIEAEMSRRGVTQELIDETRAATENQMLQDLTEIAARCGDLEYPDKQGATPLHIASANGYTKVVEFLLENHVNVDATDKDLWSPVHAAACWGHMEVLEMLAMSGADLNAKNKNDETPSGICEDAEIRERIEQLKTEQESKRLAEAQRRRVRRSQSNNTRAQSVRRTSLRDKTLTTKKDAVEETRLRLQAQEGYTVPDSTTEPNSITSDVSNSILPNTKTKHSTPSLPTKHPNNTVNNNNNPRYPATAKPQNPLYGQGTVFPSQNHYESTLNRRSPDGKDNEAYLLEDKKMANNNNPQKIGNDISTEIFSASNENGKINVQVTVLVDTHNLDNSLSGTTLANLKKQRAQSRSSTTSENGSLIGNPTIASSLMSGQPMMELNELNDQTPKITKFSGVTSDVVSDSTSSRRCCTIM
ncbi:hypothetical protein HA402_007194 [Bradysia odoriphaga]|nr:hypothetical protein HA402_007194 [Bradysia odoriphaga]